MSGSVRLFEDSAAEDEVALPKGDVTEGVVRVGDTVRRPHQPQSPAVSAYLDHLEGVGFDGSPRYLGRDRRGRDVLSFVAGAVAGDPPQAWVSDDDLLASVAVLVRRLHGASTGYGVDRAFAAPAGSVWSRDRLSAEDRAALPDLGVERARFSHIRMRAAAEQHGGGWARMWAAGVGEATLRRERWLIAQRDAILAALR